LSFLIINGENEFLKERAAKEHASTRLASETLTFFIPEDLNSYLRMSQFSSMDSGEKVFIVWSKSEIPLLPINEKDSLIVVARDKKLSDSRAKVITVSSPKKNFQGNGYVRWIIEEGESYKINLSRIAGALFVNNGTCLRKLASEIEKIALISSNSEVTPEEAKSVMCFTSEIDPSFLVDAVCSGETKKAISIWEKIQDHTHNFSGLVIAYMHRHLLQVLKLEKARPGSDVRMTAPRKFSDCLGFWSVPSLQKSSDIFASLDIGNRRGDLSVPLGIELELIRLSEESRSKHA
jgi:DNA polymerase III delta subunit